MTVPQDLRYTKEDEWVRVEDGEAAVGITAYAQDQLGDIVYVEFPEVGDSFDQDEAFGEVESVKATAELYMPLAGEVIAVNEELEDTPELINQDPYGAWMIRIRIDDPGQVDALLDAEQYGRYLSERE
ncbi:MAG: glycine cleavage system protein GcvH [Anaerolineae bacterium]|nr:glycine cleavage system protein GcvH [Anaerolineae bacterium]